MIADMASNEKLHCVRTTFTDVFIRGRKLNISLVFFTRLYFPVPKDVSLNTTLLYNEDSKQKIASKTCN